MNYREPIMALIDEDQKSRIRALLKKNSAIEEIAANVGVSPSSVRAIKAWHRRKWCAASRKAHGTGKNAKTFTKYFLAKDGYRCMDLDSKTSYEYKGIVDLIAVRRDSKDPDLLTIILFQVKGGGARVTDNERNRLRKAASRIKIQWNIAVKPGTRVKFQKNLP